MKITSKALFLLLGFAITGCGSNNITAEWSCPIDQPDGCHSIENGDEIAIGKISGIEFTQVNLDKHSLAKDRSETTSAGLDTSRIERVRIPETLTSIWIGPFVDESGNYHPAGEIYIVLRPAEWRDQ